MHECTTPDILSGMDSSIFKISVKVESMEPYYHNHVNFDDHIRFVVFSCYMQEIITLVTCIAYSSQCHSLFTQTILR